MQLRNQKTNNDIVLSAKIAHLASSALFIICGALISFVQAFDSLLGFVIVGIASIVIGIAGIYGYFSNDMYRLAFQSDFAIGVFNVIFGVLMIINPGKTISFLPIAIGIITLIDGGNKAQISFEGYNFGLSKWFLVMISAIIELVVGTVVLILTATNVDTRIWMGIAMMVVGAVNFWTTMYMVRIRNRGRDDE